MDIADTAVGIVAGMAADIEDTAADMTAVEMVVAQKAAVAAIVTPLDHAHMDHEAVRFGH